MLTLKERRELIEKNYTDYIKQYRDSVLLPEWNQIILECEAIGHVNAQTITRDDGSQYYICDNCKKMIAVV